MPDVIIYGSIVAGPVLGKSPSSEVHLAACYGVGKIGLTSLQGAERPEPAPSQLCPRQARLVARVLLEMADECEKFTREFGK